MADSKSQTISGGRDGCVRMTCLPNSNRSSVETSFKIRLFEVTVAA